MATAYRVIHDLPDKMDLAKVNYSHLVAPLSENEEQYDKLIEEIATFYLDDQSYEYADTLRLARQDRPETVAQYNYTQSQGCCGSKDTEFVCNGVTFMVGFNYGH